VGTELKIPPTPGLKVCSLGHSERRREPRKEVAVVLAIGHTLRAHEALSRPDTLPGFLEVVHRLFEDGVFVAHNQSIRVGILRRVDKPGILQGVPTRIITISPRHGMAMRGKAKVVYRAVLRPRILGRQDLLTRDDLEAMREEFGAGERDDGGLPFSLEDDLHQMRLVGQVGLDLECWAEARGVPLAYGEALLRYLTQG
jgi:hypothetical protein